MAITRIDPRSPSWFGFFLGLWLLSSAAGATELLNAIVAVVNEDVIVRTELEQGVKIVQAQLQDQGKPVPPRRQLEHQVLEQLIRKRLQLQQAKKLGIEISEAELTKALSNIAARNGLTLEQLQQVLENSGMRYEDFREDTRTQMLIARLQAQAVIQNIQVTEPEIDRFLRREGDKLIEREAVRLGHILIAVSETASEATIEKARKKAQRLVKKLRSGADFAEIAQRESDGQRAAEGGDLGWFEMAAVPSLVEELVYELDKGEISDPLRSPSGFHIIKLIDLKTKAPAVVTQTHARHILIRTNELVSDSDAKARLNRLRLRLLGGGDFATLARANSDDTGSALKGGDLGWLSPGDTVPEFEKVMDALAVQEISKPFKTSFGWHIVQVLARRRQDTAEALLRLKAKEVLRERKAKRAIEAWLQQLRDEAYVEIRLPEGEKR